MRMRTAMMLSVAVLGSALVWTQAAKSAAQSEAKERARLVLSHALPPLDGDHLQISAVEVKYGPGESSPQHSHPCPVVGYVVEGAYRMQVKGEPEMVYKAGESFLSAQWSPSRLCQRQFHRTGEVHRVLRLRSRHAAQRTGARFQNRRRQVTMAEAPLTASHPASDKSARILTPQRLQRLERVGILYARLALGSAFLSAVADRFGLWGKYGGWGNFATFTKYTAEVNSFMPSFTIPFLAWTATIAETLLGIALIVGLWSRWAALGTAILLAMFGIAMAISLGVKSPMDYSVFSASAGALLLALYPNDRPGTNS